MVLDVSACGGRNPYLHEVAGTNILCLKCLRTAREDHDVLADRVYEVATAVVADEKGDSIIATMGVLVGW